MLDMHFSTNIWNRKIEKYDQNNSISYAMVQAISKSSCQKYSFSITTGCVLCIGWSKANFIKNNIYDPLRAHTVKLLHMVKWLTGLVWCCPKKVYTLGLLEDIARIQYAWGIFFFKRAGSKNKKLNVSSIFLTKSD